MMDAGLSAAALRLSTFCGWQRRCDGYLCDNERAGAQVRRLSWGAVGHAGLRSVHHMGFTGGGVQ